MKNNKNNKDFDAVKMMRDIRDSVSSEIKDMSYEELREYIDSRLDKKSRYAKQS